MYAPTVHNKSVCARPAPVPQGDSYAQPPAPAQFYGSEGSSSSSSSSNSWKNVQEALCSLLDSETYGLAGTQDKIRITAVATSGMLSYTTRQGKARTGTYQIEGSRMTIQMEGYTMVYTITSSTSFSGGGENRVKTGY
jgi:hypothetical protein